MAHNISDLILILIFLLLALSFFIFIFVLTSTEVQTRCAGHTLMLSVYDIDLIVFVRLLLMREKMSSGLEPVPRCEPRTRGILLADDVAQCH